MKYINIRKLFFLKLNKKIVYDQTNSREHKWQLKIDLF